MLQIAECNISFCIENAYFGSCFRVLNSSIISLDKKSKRNGKFTNHRKASGE